MTYYDRCLTYISNTRIPSRKANTYQSFCMCEAFSPLFAEVNFLYPRRWNPDKSLCDDPFTYYNVDKNFHLTALESLDNKYFASSLPIGYAFTNTLFGLVVSIRLAMMKKSARKHVIYLRDVGALKCISLLRRCGLLKNHLIIFEEHVYSGNHLHYLRFIDGLVVINEHLKKLYSDSLDLPILTAHDGVRLQEHLGAHGNRSASQGAVKTVLYLGNFYPWKGVSTLAEAAKHVSGHVVFQFVGGSHDVNKDFFKAVKGKNNISVLGFVERKLALNYLNNADVVVVPNSGRDPMSSYTSPLKLFEYMAARKPVVASRLASLQEILRDHENAVLFNPDDPADLAEKISWVLNNDCSHLVDQAWKDVQEYSWNKRAEKIVQWLGKLELGRDAT